MLKDPPDIAAVFAAWITLQVAVMDLIIAATPTPKPVKDAPVVRIVTVRGHRITKDGYRE